MWIVLIIILLFVLFLVIICVVVIVESLANWTVRQLKHWKDYTVIRCNHNQLKCDWLIN